MLPLSGVTKYRIGRIGPLRQGKPTHRIDQDVQTLGLGVRLVLGSDASVRVIRRRRSDASDAVFRHTAIKHA